MNIVDKQLLAYNNCDIETFLDCYTDDIEVYMLETNQLLTKGKEQLRKTMSASFIDKPNSHAILLSRLSQNNLIIDVENLAGHIDGQVITSAAIYEITGDQISKLWFGGRSIEPVKH